jgi:DUF4097 and DUF4098 domain-containing protein YvlB
MHLHPLARRGAVLLAAGAASMLLAACEVNLATEGLSSTETKTFSVTGQPSVTLETFDGAIDIHSWDRRDVQVEVEKRAMDQALIDDMKVQAEQNGDRIVLRVTGPPREQFRGVTIGVHVSPSARLRVSVPRESTIEARTLDGAIRLEDVTGNATLRTSDGSVTVVRVTGDLQVHTSDGSIRLDGTDGKLDLETGDGSITIDARPTVLRARTDDGSIRVQIRADTVMADNWELTTGDGSVVVHLPPTFNADLDAETSDGRVRTDHPHIKMTDDQGEGERRDRRTLRAKMGDGGRLLRIRTGDGTIRIEG